jgi:hypothetical protein
VTSLNGAGHAGPRWSLAPALDRDRKGSRHARAGLADCWILNPVSSVLEVYREPVADSAAAFGWRYGSSLTLGADAVVGRWPRPTPPYASPTCCRNRDTASSGYPCRRGAPRPPEVLA